MSEIRLFIASSSRDTEHERFVIGDLVRKLNDKYEPQGHRIRLCCWEDFTPEFTGTRKQSEYNEQLIKKSQLFVALFREVCGRFTQEEIKVWTDSGKVPLVLDIQGAGVDKTTVHGFLAHNGLDKTAVVTDADIIAQVTALVEDYMRTATMTQPSKAAIKQIYATIPDDRVDERLPFSNLVRSVDDMAEEFFHLRCRLIQEEPDQISTSDYYTAILKDTLDANEESEILLAINESVRKHNPYIALYFNHGDLVCQNHPNVERAISNNGLFNEKFDGIFRVRYHLLRWLIQQSVLRIDLTVGIDVQDGWFVFCGLPIIPLTSLGITGGTAWQQTTELIKKLSFAVLGANPNQSLADMDLNVLDEQLMRADAIYNAAQSVGQAAMEKKQRLLDQITACIDSILSSDVTEHAIKKLTAFIERKERLQKDLKAAPRDLIRTQMLMVQAHDTYPEVFATTGIDIDAQYKKIADTADRFGIKDPTVEMMRMNYANYLHGQNRNAEALKLYETAIGNLDALDDHAELYRSYIMHLYVTYINHLSFLTENEKALEAIQRLEKKMAAWEDYGLSVAERLSNKSRLLSCKLRMRPLRDDILELLNEAMTTFQHVMQIPEDAFDNLVCDELFCDLPICIASATIDVMPYVHLSVAKVKNNVDFFLRQVVRYASQHEDSLSCLSYLGNAYHNWGFFYSDALNDQTTARQFSMNALAVREKIYKVTQRPMDKYEIAQTLLLIGATYVNGIQGSLSEEDFVSALDYANTCLRIYRELNVENYLEQQARVYEALQLKGSIYYHAGERHKGEGLMLLKRVWDWNNAHPRNSYEAVFIGVAGVILKEEGLI